jgi:hypothetical protein
MRFRLSATERAAKLVATEFAFLWTGHEEAAEAVRDAVAAWILDAMARVDAASHGRSGKVLARVLSACTLDLPDVGDPSHAVTRDQLAARRVAAILQGFLPAHQRTLSDLLGWLSEGEATTPAPAPESAPAPAAPDRAPATSDLSAQSVPSARSAVPQSLLPASTAALLSPVLAAARWPRPDDLLREVGRELGRLRKLADRAGLADIAAWYVMVPAMTVASKATATLIQNAFARLGPATGVVDSSMDLGNIVHEQFVDTIVRDFVKAHGGRYLVAEDWAFPPPLFSKTLLDTVKEVRQADKDFSLVVLQQSRGSLDGTRAKDSKTSREDLVIFSPQPISGASVLADARPELYEIKSIKSLMEAVGQVHVYSRNYLGASIEIRRLKGGVPNFRIDNSLMLPASPESRSIALPLLTISEVISVARAGPIGTAAEIAKFVQQVIEKSQRVAYRYIACPFMITGLYGIVPYFVVNLRQLSGAINAAIASIVSTLVSAILAYLAAKRTLDELLDKAGELVVALLAMVGMAILAIVLLLALPFEVAGIAIGGPVVAGIGALLLLFGTGDEAPSPQQPPDRGTVQLGALTMVHIGAERFAVAVQSAMKLFAQVAAGAGIDDTPALPQV